MTAVTRRSRAGGLRGRVQKEKKKMRPSAEDAIIDDQLTQLEAIRSGRVTAPVQRFASGIHGYGLVAVRAVQVGDVVADVFGKQHALDSPAAARARQPTCHVFKGIRHQVQLSLREARLARYSTSGLLANSADFSEDAVGNCMCRTVLDEDGRESFFLEATRDIKAGDEILINTYGMEFWREAFRMGVV
jgi:SET domain-containing protein